MPLSNYPEITKYTIDDTVYVFEGNQIKELVITGWRVEVYDTNGDGTGTAVQETYYQFSNHSELKNTLVFSSWNHIRSEIKGDYLNRAIESGSGGSGFVRNLFCKDADPLVPLTFGSWTDFAGFDLRVANFINSGDVDPNENIDVVFVTGELIFDRCNLDEAGLPTGWDTKAEFRANVKSFDKDTTIWTDGNPIGLT
jgi:hypothetical protein